MSTLSDYFSDNEEEEEQKEKQIVITDPSSAPDPDRTQTLDYETQPEDVLTSPQASLPDRVTLSLAPSRPIAVLSASDSGSEAPILSSANSQLLLPKTSSSGYSLGLDTSSLSQLLSTFAPRSGSYGLQPLPVATSQQQRAPSLLNPSSAAWPLVQPPQEFGIQKESFASSTYAALEQKQQRTRLDYDSLATHPPNPPTLRPVARQFSSTPLDLLSSASKRQCTSSGKLIYQSSALYENNPAPGKEVFAKFEKMGATRLTDREFRVYYKASECDFQLDWLQNRMSAIDLKQGDDQLYWCRYDGHVSKGMFVDNWPDAMTIKEFIQRDNTVIKYKIVANSDGQIVRAPSRRNTGYVILRLTDG